MPKNAYKFLDWTGRVLYPSKFILLLSSCIKSSVKLRGPVPETVTHAHGHDNTSTILYRGGCMLWIICSFLFFSTFLLSHHLSKGSSLSHQSINSSKTLLAHFCAFFTKSNLAFLIFVAAQRFTSCRVASVILCQSLLRKVDCQSITPAFWKLLVILQTRLLGFIFTAFMICLSYYLINCCCFLRRSLLLFSQAIRSLLVAGVAGGFQTLDFSMPFVFARALTDFLFSFSIQIACFSLKVSSLVFILVYVCHPRMQDSEYRSNGYNWYDIFPAFNIWRIQQDTADHLQRPVRQLFQYLCSHQMGVETLKVLNFLAGKTSMSWITQ